MKVTAGRGGLWTAKLNVIPEERWVYGVATDPVGRDKPAYFRVNVTTRQQERVDPAEFNKMFGASLKKSEEESQGSKGFAPSGSQGTSGKH
jgi:hypothetical protein